MGGCDRDDGSEGRRKEINSYRLLGIVCDRLEIMNRGRIWHSGRHVAAAIMLSAAYVMLEWISSIHEYKGLPFTAWDPGLGLLFAAMILYPAVGAPALAMGIIASEAIVLQSILDWQRMTALSLIVTTVYLCTAIAVRKSKKFDSAIPRLSDIMLLIGAGISGALVSAFLLLTFLILAGNLTTADIIVAGASHLIGDIIGIAVISPLCLRLVRQPALRLRIPALPAILEGAVALAILAIFAWLSARPEGPNTLQYFYLLFVPVVFSAVRHGLTGASVMLAITQAALVIVLDRIEADASKFNDYQTLMLILTGTGLLVGAITSERDAARHQAKAMEWESARAARFNLVSGMAAALSHEISQPLTAARARARTIVRLIENNDLARTVENLGPLVAQIDRAADILQHMREFLRRGSPERKRVHWHEVIAGARSLIAPLASEKNVKLEFSARTPVLPVYCDRVQIEQVLINLISNAIEAITSSGQVNGIVAITAAVADEQKMLEVSIRDNGPGVDPSIMSKLFNPMTTTRDDGLGLGIAICASILDTQNGRLWLDRSEKGHTEFRFRLPLAPNGEQS